MRKVMHFALKSSEIFGRRFGSRNAHRILEVPLSKDSVMPMRSWIYVFKYATEAQVI